MAHTDRLGNPVPPAAPNPPFQALDGKGVTEAEAKPPGRVKPEQAPAPAIIFVDAAGIRRPARLLAQKGDEFSISYPLAVGEKELTGLKERQALGQTGGYVILPKQPAK